MTFLLFLLCGCFQICPEIKKTIKPFTMAQKLINRLLMKFRLPSVLLLMTLACLFLFSFTVSRRIAGDFWQQLGITRAQGTERIKESFLNGYLSYYGAKSARNIAVNDRAAIAQDLLAYAKEYLSSPEFRKEYELMRKQAKPIQPEQKQVTKEEVRKEKVAEMEKTLRNSEAAAKTNADMAKIMKPTIEFLKKTIVDYKDPASKHIENFYVYEVNQNKDKLKSYNESVVRWETEYPEDCKEKIKTRLQEFLELSATVDFNAELKKVGDKKKFVNPQYEAKPDDWKQIYRAGKEVIDPAKKLASEWMVELGIPEKKTKANGK